MPSAMTNVITILWLIASHFRLSFGRVVRHYCRFLRMHPLMIHKFLICKTSDKTPVACTPLHWISVTDNQFNFKQIQQFIFSSILASWVDSQIQFDKRNCVPTTSWSIRLKYLLVFWVFLPLLSTIYLYLFVQNITIFNENFSWRFVSKLYNKKASCTLISLLSVYLFFC